MSPDPVEILLVEDNPVEVRLSEEALTESGVAAHVSVVGDGVEAAAFLRREGKYADAPRPNIILLDLALPKKGGLELLSEIKADSELRQIPVVVLTSSANPADVLKAYDLQASCYITKPGDLDEFVRVLTSVRDFCLTVVQLPSQPEGGS